GAVADSVGSIVAAGKLGKASQLDDYCGAADSDGCRTCQVAVDTYVPYLGRLSLASAEAVDDGIIVYGNISPDPTEPRRAPGKLGNLRVDPWTYPTAACRGPSSDPRRVVRFDNTGQLPLNVCEVAQFIPDPSAQPAVLSIDRTLLGTGPNEREVGDTAVV